MCLTLLHVQHGIVECPALSSGETTTESMLAELARMEIEAFDATFLADDESSEANDDEDKTWSKKGSCGWQQRGRREHGTERTA